MAISSIASGAANIAAMQPQMQAEGPRERENDGDADDGVSPAATNAQPAPTVNTSGQSIGNIVNVKA